MCMRNLNATITTCVDAKRNSANSNVLTYNNVFDVIVPKDIGGKTHVLNIDIIVDISAVFDENKEGRFIQKDQEYDCRLAVTFDGVNFKGIGDFPLVTESSKLSACGNRSFCNITLLLKEQNIEIPESAMYCDLVLLVKYPPKEESGKWILQTIKRLYINKPTQ